MKKWIGTVCLCFGIAFLIGCTLGIAKGKMETKKNEKPVEVIEEDSGNLSKDTFHRGLQVAMKKADLKRKPVTIDIVMMGDVAFGSNFGKKKRFDKVFREKGSRYFMEGIQPYLSQADLRIANLENVFTDSNIYQKGKKYTYKAYSKDYINVLTVNGIDYVNVVNNHMGDYLQKGFDDTLVFLQEHGIKYFGTNYYNSSNPEIGSVKVDKTEMFEKDGFKIGMMGYLGFNTSYPSGESVANNIKELKSQGADFIIASLHGGGQNTTKVTTKQIELAHMMIDLGADMVYGHHPHVLQKTEEYKGKKIYYSLGNFLFIDYGSSKHPESVLVRLQLTKDANGNITAKYEDIPVLWTGTDHTNHFRPTITNSPNKVERIRKILAGKLSF